MPIEQEPVTGIRVLNAALDEREVFGKKKIVLRGVLEQDHLGLLKVDDYQRERLHVKRGTDKMKGSSLWEAMKAGEQIPDIELGMRGDNFVEIPDSLDVVLRDPVYLIDGLQRVTHALVFLEQEVRDVPLGAIIHFGTTREWERDRFDVLNTSRRKVSPNVLLRNHRETNNGMLTLYGLSESQKDFAMFKRVSWGQNMQRGEMISAMTLTLVSLMLHRHITGTIAIKNATAYQDRLNRLISRLPLNQFRQNVVTFYELLDKAWGIRNVAYSAECCWLRSAFQEMLATFLSNHTDFWKDDNELFISAEHLKRLSTFPVHDPSVINLSGAHGRTMTVLQQMLLDHMNKGKSSNQLTHRSKLADDIERTRVENAEASAD